MKAYWGSGCITPRILDLGTNWRSVVSFTPRLLYPQGKIPWYPFDRRLSGPQSWSGRGGEEKNSRPLPGLESLIIQLVAQRYTTELIAKKTFPIPAGSRTVSIQPVASRLIDCVVRAHFSRIKIFSTVSFVSEPILT
jgi:hypothetical protein